MEMDDALQLARLTAGASRQKSQGEALVGPIVSYLLTK
jgi:hypothetical protein